MKALVTGGGGFLGQAIVRALRARGDTVRSFSRQAYAALDALGVEQVRGDLASAAAVSEAAQGCDAVFHVAAKPGIWGDYVDYFAANVTGDKPAFANASLPFRVSPLNSAFPSPISTQAKWASGARSPLAPRLPFSGMIG